MGKQELILYGQNDINRKTEIIRHNNAFILADGSFYLAKGYTGCNPSHQLESSALTIVRKEAGYDIKKADCGDYFKGLGINYKGVLKGQTKYLYYLRGVLVHYYGYALFARQEIINSWDDRKKFFDCSLIPDPKYYGSDFTSPQIETLKELFELNDDGTMFTNSGRLDSNYIFKLVLNRDAYHSSWNY